MVKSTRKKTKPPKTIDLDKTDFVDETDASAATDAALEAAMKEKAEKAKDTLPDADLDKAANEGEASNVQDETIPIKPAKKKSRFGLIVGTFLAATAGGALALGGAGALNKMGWLEHIPYAEGLVYGAQPTQEDSSSAAELETLKNEILALKSAAPQIDSTQLEARLSAIETSLQSSSTDSGADNSTKIESAAQKAEEALAQVAQLKEIISAGGGEGAANLDVSSIRADLKNELQALQTRLAQVEASSKNSAQSILGVGNLSSDISALNAQVAKLENQSVAQSEALSALNQKIETEVLVPMSQVQAAAGAAMNGEKIARSVNVNSLKAALENGGVFTNELLAAEALLGADDIINSLKPIAAAGILTPEQLLENFDVIEDQMTATIEAPSENSSILDKFMASAKSLVKVRKKGPQAGDDVMAISSRIRDALSLGDVFKAKSEWDSLSAPAKEISKGWSADLSTRLNAQKLISNLIEQLSDSGKN